MTRLGRLMAGAAIILLVLVGTEGTASAHAQLESTNPNQSSVLLAPPPQVVLHFGEPVEIDFGSCACWGPTGSGSTTEAPTTRLATVMPSPSRSRQSSPGHLRGCLAGDLGGLPSGTRGVRLLGGHGQWRRQGQRQATSLANESGSAVVGTIYWLVRFAAFVGLLFLVGLAVMVAVLGGRGGDPTGRTSAVALVVVLLGATVRGIAIQGVYAAELPLGDIFGRP